MNRRQFVNKFDSSLLLVSAVITSGVILLAEDMPAVGNTAPSFTLNSQEGNRVSLEEFRGKWVVLYFHPKDMTSGCTLEAHNFQRDLARYHKRNAVIVGVSVDNLESHQEFCAKESRHDCPCAINIAAEEERVSITRDGENVTGPLQPLHALAQDTIERTL